MTFSSGYIFAVAAIAQNTMTINGTMYGPAVTGANVTLANADPANPRIDTIWIDNTGTFGSTAGAPKALTTTSGPVPTAPATTQYVLARVFVPAANTPAMSATSITDLRAAGSGVPFTRVATQNAALTTTATIATTLYTSPTLAIPVTQGVRIRGNFRKTASAAQAVGLGLTVNATVVYLANISAGYLAISSGAAQAEDGWFEVFIYPRSSANYLNGVERQYRACVSSTGVVTTSATIAQGNVNAVMPNATITSILITGINDTANNNVEIFNVTIDTMPN